MWDDGYALDLRSEARDEVSDDAAFEEHDLNHNSEDGPVEGCSFCVDEWAEREMDARAEREGVGEAA
jgi:hypothetical protein